MIPITSIKKMPPRMIFCSASVRTPRSWTINGVKMAGDFYYLKTPEEMAADYKDIPEAMENTGKIADKCNLELEFERLHLPTIELPPGKTAFQYLADLCYEGLPKYYPQPTKEIQERLAYELDVIEKTKFANYFLVVWDIISFVRKSRILYGVRGSAAASIVLHCLGITEVDPIETKLVFERFLNIERKEMPDIDMDFEDYRRDEVIEYVSEKYGADHVAQIITFGTLGARAALRDVGRALGMTYDDVDRVAKLVPFAVNMTLDRPWRKTTNCWKLTGRTARCVSWWMRRKKSKASSVTPAPTPPVSLFPKNH